MQEDKFGKARSGWVGLLRAKRIRLFKLKADQRIRFAGVRLGYVGQVQLEMTGSA